MAACSNEQQDRKPAQPAAQEAPALERTPSTPDARVFFITPEDGATVTSPVAVEFGMDGMAVVPAGDTAPASGHHHILIDTGLPDLDLPVPNDDRHVHFGDGSSATQLTLPPGEHTLQLLFADHLHIPHEPPVYSERITITVE
ncbi:MAG: DUF4399 domain-containing protein [Gammaproteobacteria bacterium]|nr:DUF4399 domain-containing protein [Gammaproteobacteria bacterium]